MNEQPTKPIQPPDDDGVGAVIWLVALAWLSAVGESVGAAADGEAGLDSIVELAGDPLLL